MSAPETAPAETPATDETAVDEVLVEFGGDARKAIAALLHDLDALAADARSVVSRGFVRGIDFTEWDTAQIKDYRKVPLAKAE